ncbi:MAG: GTP-binding protein Era [Halothiobacillaceae bacterium]|nr:MAG: GTP-binding protein Era [Halothiobacillaceae bacterium]
MSAEPAPFRCGYVAIVGRPNVGKSTLMNRLIGQKISITSHKPQTTRHRIHGIKTTAEAQLIFVDTPGLHADNKKQLNRVMNRTALSAVADVDVVVFVIEGTALREGDSFVLSRLEGITAPLIVVINKVDKIEEKGKLLPFLQKLQELTHCREIVPLSARNGDNVERLVEAITALLPAGEAIFGEEEITDRSMRFIAAEIVREKLMRRLGQELPYSVAVEVESYVENEHNITIDAAIWVERASQKGIVIGKQGHMLKEIGTQARKDLEKSLGTKVVLRLWVKVKEGWSEDGRILRSLGLGLPRL